MQSGLKIYAYTYHFADNCVNSFIQTFISDKQVHILAYNIIGQN